MEPLLSGKARVAGDSVTHLGSLPFFAAEKRFYRIDWTTRDGVSSYNHYLAGSPPFDLSTYRRWIEQLQRL
jgi:beta-mannosidase